MKIICGDNEVTAKDNVKYLGVSLDQSLGGKYIAESILNKSTLDNSPPLNYDKESKDECHHVNNNPRYKWYVK